MNLLFIFSDQHSKEKTGCYGNPYIKTPNIDSLAKRGTKFTSAYSNSPICVPARACLATGRYANQLKLWDNAFPYLGEEFDSWGHRLENEGIDVTTFGKLHFRYPEDNTGFKDQRLPLHVRDGIGDLFGAIRERDACKLGLAKSVREPKIGESSYTKLDKQIADEACSYLVNESVNKDKPWVMQVGFVLPHFPFIAPQEYWDLYNEEDLPLPKNYAKNERPEYPFCVDHRHYQGTDEELSPEQLRKTIHAYYGMCSYVDSQIGRVLQALEESGQLENTRIIYSTDHGEMLGDHGLWYKSCMFEGSAGIPFIMAGPDIPEDETVDVNISLVDIFPTILDCVGLKPLEADEDLPGATLLPLARGENKENRVVFSEFHASGSFTGGFMIRKQNFKLIQYVGYPSVLFNLEDDPDELTNIAEVSAYAEVLNDLRRELFLRVNPEAVDKQAKDDQTTLLNKHGGREFLKGTVPIIFSPVQGGAK